MTENAKKSNRHKIRAEYGKDIFGMNVIVCRPLILESKKSNELNEMKTYVRSAAKSPEIKSMNSSFCPCKE